MKIPRDLSGKELINILKDLGYQITHQSGSHIRLTTTENGTHHITIPNHNFLRVGTLSHIVLEVANHFNLSKKEMIERLCKKY